MSTHHRPAALRARALLATAALCATAVAGVPSAASAAPSSHGPKAHTASGHGKHQRRAKRKPVHRPSAQAQRGDRHPLIVRWTGVPRAGEWAGRTISDTFAFGGQLFFVGHQTTADSAVSIWGPIIDTGTVAVDRVPSAVEILPVKGGGFCATSAEWLAAQRRYADGFQQSVEAIEQWRTDAKRRGALPAGPEIGGRATVSGTVATWPTLDRSGATVTLDAATGQVLRITPIGMPEYAVDLSAWSVEPGTQPELVAIAGDPLINGALYATDLCR